MYALGGDIHPNLYGQYPCKQTFPYTIKNREHIVLRRFQELIYLHLFTS